MSNLEYLKQLAQRAQRLVGPRPTAGLDYFRSKIIANPDGIRRKLFGANALRLRELGIGRRSYAATLDVRPDLLSPLGELRYEPAHTKLIGYFLDAKLSGSLASSCLDSFLRLINVTDEVVGVASEYVLKNRRVDICISMKKTLVFVEIKLDSEEGSEQLKDYRDLLRQQSESSQREGVLVYLSLFGGSESLSWEPHHRLAFSALLQAWLPFAVGSAPECDYLARYLKSLALLVGRAESGDFDSWSFAAQRNCISMLEEMTDEQD